MDLTSSQRAYLRGLADQIEPIAQIGKSGLTPAVSESVNNALEKRELVKVSILKSCFDDPKDLAGTIAERTHSAVVQVIGRKFVLYRPSKKKPKIELPQKSRKS